MNKEIMKSKYIGLADFRKLVTGNDAYYVDKSLFYTTCDIEYRRCDIDY